MASKNRAGWSVSDYLNEAKRLSYVAPSARKYRRRKTLKSWEKAHIARLSNEVHRVNSGFNGLVPLTKTQLRNLDDPEQVIVGNGIQAVRVTNMGPEFSVHVHKGELIIEGEGAQEGRNWHIVTVRNPDDLLPTAIDLFNQYGDGHIQANLFTTMGRTGEGVTSENQAVERWGGLSDKYGSIAEWIIGIAWLWLGYK